MDIVLLLAAALSTLLLGSAASNRVARPVPVRRRDIGRDHIPR